MIQHLEAYSVCNKCLGEHRTKARYGCSEKWEREEQVSVLGWLSNTEKWVWRETTLSFSVSFLSVENKNRENVAEYEANIRGSTVYMPCMGNVGWPTSSRSYECVWPNVSSWVASMFSSDREPPHLEYKLSDHSSITSSVVSFVVVDETSAGVPRFVDLVLPPIDDTLLVP